MTDLSALRDRWLSEAQFLRRNGADASAIVVERLASELDRALHSVNTEELTVEEAAIESGYSVSRIRHMLSDGLLPNVGAERRPRICRGDLPKKVKSTRSGGAFDPFAAAVRSAARGSSR